MSATYTSDVVIGIRLSDVFRMEDRYHEVTKYDPDTGKPYATEDITRHFFLFGKEIPEPEEILPYEWKELQELKLDVFSTGNSVRKHGQYYPGWDYYNWGMFVIGKKMFVLEPGSLGEIDTDGAEMEIQIMKNKLLKATGVEVNPKLWNIFYLGY